MLDEIQKIEGWSETVKRLWDEDSRKGSSMHVILLGSSALMIEMGLTESLAGRFEMIRVPHWSFPEMNEAFDITLNEYIFFGSYPGTASLFGDFPRWKRMVLDSLIETTVSRDILMHARIEKPALLRRLFHLVCDYSAQILSYQKMIGHLQDAGNTTTLAHYLRLLESAGLCRALQKYEGRKHRLRSSIPKLQVFNSALISAQSNLDLAGAMANTQYWGSLVESTVGAHLINHAFVNGDEVYYWRDGNHEVDFVVQRDSKTVAFEVKSGRSRGSLSGMAALCKRHANIRPYLIGKGGIDLEEFLRTPWDSFF